MNKTIRRILLVTITSLCISTMAFAISLNEAKSQGLVGETPSGYLAAVQGSSDVNALVAKINGLRKAEYQKIANKNGTSLSAVEKLAAQKAIAKTPAGQFIKDNSGSWKKK